MVMDYGLWLWVMVMVMDVMVMVMDVMVIRFVYIDKIFVKLNHPYLGGYEKSQSLRQQKNNHNFSFINFFLEK